MEIREDLTLGIDLGIASCGWAVISQNDAGGEIAAWGARMFDAPETDKERTPTNQLRRGFRGMRRVLRRRRQRMNEIRKLFKAAGLLASDLKSALWIRDGVLIDPWKCRAEGLDRRTQAGGIGRGPRPHCETPRLQIQQQAESERTRFRMIPKC